MNKPRNYIEYNNTNSQWNDGYIYVYLKGELVQHFSVDEIHDMLWEFDEVFDLYDFIDDLKIKYGITKVVEKSDVNKWR